MSLEESTCRSCGAAIYWTHTDRGKRIPLDVAPKKNGNIIIRDGRAHYVGIFDQVGEHEATFVSHFATCRDADQWRRAKST